MAKVLNLRADRLLQGELSTRGERKMEISPIAGVCIVPTFRSRETDLGLTDVFEVESSSRTGDERYSPGGNRAAGGFEDDEEKASDQADSEAENEAEPEAEKTADEEKREISFFA
jgi:hypothetical protein